jgi:hypothetical protein
MGQFSPLTIRIGAGCASLATRFGLYRPLTNAAG